MNTTKGNQNDPSSSTIILKASRYSSRNSGHTQAIAINIRALANDIKCLPPRPLNMADGGSTGHFTLPPDNLFKRTYRLEVSAELYHNYWICCAAVVLVFRTDCHQEDNIISRWATQLGASSTKPFGPVTSVNHGSLRSPLKPHVGLQCYWLGATWASFLEMRYWYEKDGASNDLFRWKIFYIGVKTFCSSAQIFTFSPIKFFSNVVKIFMLPYITRICKNHISYRIYY